MYLVRGFLIYIGRNSVIPASRDRLLIIIVINYHRTPVLSRPVSAAFLRLFTVRGTTRPLHDDRSRSLQDDILRSVNYSLLLQVSDFDAEVT